jgi:hypothetical protein
VPPSTINEVTSNMRLVIFCVAAMAALSACGQTVDAPTAPATSSDASLPAGFPDLVVVATVDANDYRVNHPYMNGVVFRTPDGMSCGYNSMNSLSDPNVTVVSCTGPRPDKGPGDWEVRVATDKAATVEQASPPLNPTYQAGQGTAGRLLPAQHSIAYKGFQCGTGDKGTACRTGDHGFVLTATETKLF